MADEGHIADDYSKAITVLMAEYNALRNEVGYRTTAQHTLLSLSLTGFAGLGGLVIAQGANVLLLLIVALAATALGLLWLDHAMGISDIAIYVNDVLAPAANKLTSRANKLTSRANKPISRNGLLGWQGRLGPARRQPLRLLWAAAMLMVYVGSSIVSLVVTYPTVFGNQLEEGSSGSGTAWAGALWLVGAAGVALVAVLFVVIVLRATGEQSKT
jgi:hypothetical protein